MNNPTYCPKCGTLVKKYSNPTPTADVVIYDEKRGIVLVRRVVMAFVRISVRVVAVLLI